MKFQIKNEKYKFGVKFIYEPGYKKNIDLRRIYSHRIAAKNLMNLLEKEGDYDLLYAEIPPNDVALAAAEYAKKKGIPFVADGCQLYLPFLGMAVYKSIKKEVNMDKMSPIAQSLFLYLLYANRGCKVMKKQAAEFLGVTRTSLPERVNNCLRWG